MQLDTLQNKLAWMLKMNENHHDRCFPVGAHERLPRASLTTRMGLDWYHHPLIQADPPSQHAGAVPTHVENRSEPSRLAIRHGLRLECECTRYLTCSHDALRRISAIIQALYMHLFWSKITNYYFECQRQTHVQFGKGILILGFRVMISSSCRHPRCPYNVPWCLRPWNHRDPQTFCFVQKLNV